LVSFVLQQIGMTEKIVLNAITELQTFYCDAKKKKPISGKSQLAFPPALFSEADVCFHFAKILSEKYPKDWIHLEFPFNKRRLGNHYKGTANRIDICVVDPLKLSDILSEKFNSWSPNIVPLAIEIKMSRVNETGFKNGIEITKQPFVEIIKEDVESLNYMISQGYVEKGLMLIIDDRKNPKLGDLKEIWKKGSIHNEQVDIFIID
jgi:hypothetical protein